MPGLAVRALIGAGLVAVVCQSVTLIQCDVAEHEVSGDAVPELALSCDEAGRPEIYAVAFPGS